MLFPFDYHKPRSAREITGLLIRYNMSAQDDVPSPGKDHCTSHERKKAHILAGGSNILIDMEQGLCRPYCIIDIKDSPEQQKIQDFENSGQADGQQAISCRDGARQPETHREGSRQSETYQEGSRQPETHQGGSRSKDHICIGSAVPISKLMDKYSPNRQQPVWDMIYQAGISLATPSIRNRATIAGNLAHASPAADMAPPMMALGAVVIIAGPEDEALCGPADSSVGGPGPELEDAQRGNVSETPDFQTQPSKAVPVADFFTGPKKTVLGAAQWISEIRIPRLSADAKVCFMKRQRVKGHDLAIVNTAGLHDSACRVLRICVGACAEVPLLFELTDILKSGAGREQIIQISLERILPALRPVSDVRASADYRKDMARLLVGKTLEKIL